ncbi:MAG: GntR family transcriptional regulator [Lentisphaerae bacterium]|nr:GntR family transcriptional regulator [Lentisphaerota bacterium]
MMNLFSTSTERVRRFLLHKIIHSGNLPVRLPTERELTETLQLSRITVRRGINDLLQGGYIKKIPGRQGIYTNPEMVDVTMHSLAILLKNNYLDCRCMSVLGAMTDELQRNNCFCSLNFLQVSDDRCEHIVDELATCGFDCIISFAVNPQARMLLEKNLPVLIVESPGYPVCSTGNYISFDNRGFGEFLAQKVIARGLTDILFFGNLTGIYAGFEAGAAGKFKIGVYDEHLNKDGLKEVLKKGNYSGIAAMTREVGLRTLYDALHELPSIRKPELFLYPWKESELFKNSNPGYVTEIFDPQSFMEQLKELGKAAAHGVMQIVNDLPVDVPPVKLQK